MGLVESRDSEKLIDPIDMCQFAKETIPYKRHRDLFIVLFF